MTKKRSLAYAVKMINEHGSMSTREVFEKVLERYPKTAVSMRQFSNILRFSADIEIEWARDDPGHPSGSLRGRVGTIWRVRKK